MNMKMCKLTALLILLCFLITRDVYGQDNHVVVHDKHNTPMVFVPSGTAQVGATLDEAVQECEEIGTENKRTGDCRFQLSQSVPDGADFFITPVQVVSLKDYFIDEYEVSIKAYQDCISEDGCSNAVIEYLQGFSPYKSVDEPIRYISYLDAEKYCDWRGGYIPSEAEWEYAARGPERYSFPWGNTFDGNKVNFCDSNCSVPTMRNTLWDDGFSAISPVTSHPQDISWIGAIGMAGNLSEWTSTPYISENSSNDRITKGGYFGNTADQLLLWKRFPLLETEIREGIGFRCAKQL